MGRTWKPHCPVDLEDLRYVTVSFRGFDRRAHIGELVLNARVVSDVVSVFQRLYAADFPIETMRLVTGADLDAPPAVDGNNTSSFVCRTARQQSNCSAHAYCLAVDVTRSTIRTSTTASCCPSSPAPTSTEPGNAPG